MGKRAKALILPEIPDIDIFQTNRLRAISRQCPDDKNVLGRCGRVRTRRVFAVDVTRGVGVGALLSHGHISEIWILSTKKVDGVQSVIIRELRGR